MRNLSESHAQEFRASAIADDIVALNFRSFDGENENEHDETFDLLIQKPDHNNNGTLSGKSQNDLANALRSGGWIFEGYRGVCVKPNNPRTVKDKDGKDKVVKYESPRGAGSLQLFIPRVSWAIGRKIAAKAGSVVEAEYLARMATTVNPSDEDADFWEWFPYTNILLIITEGAKKACSLLSAGYPAIALNGVWGWGTNNRDMFGNVETDDRGRNLKTLHPDLETFIDLREIVLAFDRDEKPETVRMVEAAKAALVRAIADDNLPITQLTWRSHKGVDDYIATRGVKALDRLYANRQAVKVKPITSQEDDEIGFTTDRERGLMLLTEVDGETRSKRIGHHLEAIAYVNNPTQDGAALLLEFKTIRGHIRRWTMPRADLAGDGATIIAQLLSRDYAFNRKQKTALLDYLFSLGQQIDRTYTVTESSGWVGKSFILPHQTYGDESLKFRDVDPSPDAITQTRGTLQGWKNNVAARCGGNSRLILGLGASFAAPLLPLIGIESGGFHLVGDTSQGKTTILSVAASVTGVKDVPHWRTTTNGLESIATAFNHLCLPLDEIGQADARDVGNIAYMLANGQGKARMKRDLTSRQSKTWHLMVLSSGEVGMGRYMQQAGITQKGGQEVRLPDIPAVPDGSLYGCFETIHGARDGVEFVNGLEAAIKEHHGTALDAFLARLVEDIADLTFVGNLAKQLHLIAAKLAEGTTDNAIARVAKRFALVQVALGLAHKYGLLPFPVEQIATSISTLFEDWLAARGGDGSIEIKRAIENIQHLLTVNEVSDRVYTLPNNNDRPVRNLLAYRAVDIEGHTQELLVPPSVFDREFCNGVNKLELIRELQRLEMMPPPGLDGKHAHRRRVKGAREYFYVFTHFGNGKNCKRTGGTGGTPPQNPDTATYVETIPLSPMEKTAKGTEGTAKGNNQEVSPLSPHAKIAKGTGANLQNPDTKGDSSPVPSVPPVPFKKTGLGKISKLKVGDRVRYVGGMVKYKGKTGTIAKVCGERYICDLGGKITEQLSYEEVETI